MGSGQSRDLAYEPVTRILFGSAAQQDVAAAREWYADQPVPDLDLRFQRELEAILAKIESFPSSFRVVHRDIRQASLHRFPYSVFYHRRGEDLYVLAVLHHARHPNTWQRRR